MTDATGPHSDRKHDGVVDDLDATILVEGAAGTGKTEALITRVVALLRAGRASMTSIVLVTATSRSAGRLKQRLRAGLDAALGSTLGHHEKERFGDGKAHLEHAYIGTLPTLCARILTEDGSFAREADALRLAFASEADSLRISDEAFSSWFREVLRAPGEGVARVLRRGAARERGVDSPRAALRKATRVLIAQRHFAAPYRRAPFERAAAFDAVLAKLREAGAYAAQGDPENWLTKSLQEIQRALHAIEHRREGSGAYAHARDDDRTEAHFHTLARYKGWNYTGGRAEWFNRAAGTTMQHVRDVRQAAKSALDQALAMADADLAALLFYELQDAVDRYEEAKKNECVFDSLDALLMVRERLRNDPDARNRARCEKRFTHFLVDDARDIDALESEVLLLLMGCEFMRGEPPLTNFVLTPGKLFLAGAIDPEAAGLSHDDLSPSIYDVVARYARGSMSASFRFHRLASNIRSTPSIQSFVDTAFAMRGLLTDNASSRSEPNERPSIIALPVPRPYSDFGRMASWEIEKSFPDAVGAFIDWLIHESGWTITEPGQTTTKVRIDANHVALLFRSVDRARSDIGLAYSHALDRRNIRHQNNDNRSFFTREESVIIRSALDAIEWPSDTMSVFATLRGALFGFSDDALLAFRYTQHHLDPLRATDTRVLTDLTRPVARALEELASLHRTRNHRSITSTLEHLFRVTRAYASFALWTDGHTAIDNAATWLDLTRTFARHSGTSFRSFLPWLDAEAERRATREPSTTHGVHFLAVDEARGLEFPVVILVDPTASATSTDDLQTVDLARGLRATFLCGACPIELLEGADNARLKATRTADRLLYRAVTRASNLLVVPYVGDARDEKNAIKAPSPTWLGALDASLLPTEPRASRVAPGCPPFGEDSVLERAANTELRRSHTSIRPGLHRPRNGLYEVVFWDPHALDLDAPQEGGLRHVQSLSTGQNALGVHASANAYATWQSDHSKACQRGEQPSLRTSTFTTKPDLTLDYVHDAVTATLKCLPLDTNPETIDFEAIPAPHRFRLRDSEVREVFEIIRATLASSLLERARRAQRIERNAYIAAVKGDGSFIEGVIDLAFFEGDNGWIIVSLEKVSNIDQSNIEYALASATGCKVRSLKLIP